MKQSIQTRIKNSLKMFGRSSLSSYKGFSIGDTVKNVNNSCMHYGSMGTVVKVESLKNNSGYLIHYKVNNSGSTYKPGDILSKTEDQLEKVQK